MLDGEGGILQADLFVPNGTHGKKRRSLDLSKSVKIIKALEAYHEEKT